MVLNKGGFCRFWTESREDIVLPVSAYVRLLYMYGCEAVQVQRAAVFCYRTRQLPPSETRLGTAFPASAMS